MEQQESSALTQDELVAELHQRGYVDVNKRELAELRKLGLLPPFDRRASGLGRGKGTSKYTWLHRRKVIEQAVWVYRLPEICEYRDEAFPALWMLGYDVQLERVRESLYAPLEALTRVIEGELNRMKGLLLEDIIDDAAAEVAEEIGREEEEHQASLWMFRVPEESLTALLNIFLNRVESTDIGAGSGYNLADTPFQESGKALLEWEQMAREKCAESFGAEAAGNLSPGSLDNMMWTVLNNPQFINMHLSLPRLKEVLEACTDEDLMTVGRDVQTVREIVCRLQRLIPLIEPHLPAEIELKPTDLLRTALSVGSLCVLADLSFRRSGYGELIDRLAAMSDEFVKRFDEWLERMEAQGIDPQIAVIIETMVERLRSGLEASVRSANQAPPPAEGT